MCPIPKIDEDACIPCSCQGSIKYVHRSCIEEWIKQSGAIEGEIGHEMYAQEWVQWAIEKDYVKKDAEEEPELEDVIDKYGDKLKYLFIFIILIFILYFVIFFIVKRNMPTKTIDDLVFLVWRVFIVVLSFGIIGMYFFWKNVLENDYKEKLIIRFKMREIDAYPLLKELEEHKGHIKEFVEELKKRDPPQNIPPGQNLVDLIQH